MNLSELTKAVHGTRKGDWINVAGPGHSSKDRSLGFRLDPEAPDGFRVNSFAGDDLVSCRQHVKALLQNISEGGSLTVELESTQIDNASQSTKITAAMEIWNQAQAAQGTAVEAYLATRGCILAPSTAVGAALRFHPKCSFGARRFPAMVALIRDVLSGEPQGIHRTALNDAGTAKRTMPAGLNAKMIMGSARNGAIFLASHASRMEVAEGIETALSVQKLFEMPVWALLSAGGIARFPIIPSVEELTIFADHDDAGLKAAATCAERYVRAHVAGQIHHPPSQGTDWNDHLQGKDKVP